MSKVFFSCPNFTVKLVMKGLTIVEAAHREAIRGADDGCVEILGTEPIWRANYRRKTPAISAREHENHDRIPAKRGGSCSKFSKNRRG